MRILDRLGGRAAVRLLLISVLTGAAGSASAFDRFERLLPALAASTGGMGYDEVFRYVGFGGEPPQSYFKAGQVRFSSGVIALDKALANPEAAGTLTGVRLDQAQAVLVHGRPPGDVIVILGSKGFAAGAPAVLEKRGFEKATAGGIEMYRLDEDFVVNLKRRNPIDPFGYGLGSAQRIVVLDEFVVAARGTSYAALSAAPLARPITCVTCKTIGAMAAAIRSVAGEQAQLRAAMAYSARAFLAADDPSALLTDKSGTPVDPAELKRRLDAKGAARARLPVFGVALFVQTANATHIAVSFLDKAGAEQAVHAIAERVGAKSWGTNSGKAARGGALPANVVVNTSVSPAGPGFVALVTVTYPDEPADAAAREFVIWHQMIMNRDFWPLQILD